VSGSYTVWFKKIDSALLSLCKNCQNVLIVSKVINAKTVASFSFGHGVYYNNLYINIIAITRAIF